jgi:hypothetical protein
MSYIINENECFTIDGVEYTLVKRYSIEAIVEDNEGNKKTFKKTEQPKIWEQLII